MRRRIRPLTAFLAALALVLGAACGDDDPITAEVEGPANTVDGVSGVDSDDDPDEEVPVAGCQQLEERPDGIYSIGDAGEVEVRSSGEAAELVEVRPADGWEVVDEGSEEVTLSDGEREIEVEASVVEGEVFVEYCET